MTTRQEQANFYLKQAMTLRNEVQAQGEGQLDNVTMEQALQIAALDAAISSALYLRIIMFEARR